MKQIEFGCKNVLVSNFEEDKLKVFYIGFDFGKYRLDAFTEVIMDSLVDFAFGYHTGILKYYDRSLLKEAAKSLYSIKPFDDYRKEYIDKGSVRDDSIIISKCIDNYNKRGEFGELILHLILRDYFSTAPLLSKIYFKDSDGMTVHGFDAVHIGPDLSKNDKLSLYLGESKLYYCKNGNAGQRGVKDLVDDIKNHFDILFLKREFALIAKKKDAYKSLDEYTDKNTKNAYEQFIKNKNDYIEKLSEISENKTPLQDFISSITVPLICTYESRIFKPNLEHIDYLDDQSKEFVNVLRSETEELKHLLDKELSKLTHKKGEIDKKTLNIILILLPIPSKKELLTTLHKKLWNQQNA